MGLNAGLQSDCDASGEEWMPFPEEADILREEFHNLEEFYICDLYGSC